MLIQKRGLLTNTYEVIKDGVRVKQQGFTQSSTYTIPFTALPHTPIEKTMYSDWVWAPAIVITFLIFLAGAAWIRPTLTDQDTVSGLIFLFAILTGVFSITLGFIFQNRVIVYSDGSATLTIHAKHPSTTEVADFISELNQAKIDFYEMQLKLILDSEPSFNPKLAVFGLLQDRYINETQADQILDNLSTHEPPAEHFGFAPTTISTAEPSETASTPAQ
tara:strand:- start:264 stop:920 length:657 start_codon:yes stop_codon:yes gene_type:complete